MTASTERQPDAVPLWSASLESDLVLQGDNLEIVRAFADGSFTLIYLDPPFNTGRVQERAVESARLARGDGGSADVRRGFHGR